MKKKYLICIIVALVCRNPLFSQEIDSILNIYSDHFPQEKIHLHFDKSSYNKGETIWFKAYLMSGSEASELSKNFYADWYDASGNLIAHQVAPILGASAKGQFDIPANYASSSVHLRAYTRWMLNFDSSFLFDKDIFIAQPASAQRPSSISPVTEVHFFPEGGDLVNGLPSKIAFLAANQNGDPVDIRGAIKNNKGELIDSFAAEHAGMGSFDLEKVNAAEGYSVSWIDEHGKAGTAALPAIKKDGVVMDAQLFGSTIKMRLERSGGQAENLKTLYLLAHINQQVVYKAKIALQNRTTVLANINAGAFPSGVLQLTVFNALWQPVAERIVFINNQQYRFNVSVNSIGDKIGRRNKNTIELDVPDSTVANLSIAVTDEGLFQEKNTIISQFLLCDELKGKITDPSDYFMNNDDSTLHYLDLVMLTHGWRRFNWDDVAQARMPVIRYPLDNDFIQVSGTASGRAFNNMEKKDFITLILAGKESNKQIVPVPIEKNGVFSKGGFVFYDTAKVYFTFSQKKIADRVDVDFRTNILPPPASYLKGITRYTFRQYGPGLTPGERSFAEEKQRLENAADANMLKEVTVHSWIIPKTQLDIVNDRYSSGAFSGEAKYRGDVLDDPLALNYQNVLIYLQTHVVGLTVTPKYVSPHDPTSDPLSMKPNSDLYDVLLRGESEPPFIYLNESLSDIDYIARLPMSDIAYVKVFPPGFYGAFGNGRGGAIAIYTRKGGEDLEKAYNRDSKIILMGYTKYKEFYSPHYDDSVKSPLPDTRTTLYWNPYILTDPRNHKVQLEFYNNDISKKLRVVVEGMNAAGKLARVEKIIE